MFYSQFFIIFCVSMRIIARASSSLDDDSVDYVGFHLAAPMPIGRSDHTATIIRDDIFHDGNGPRIYIVGGCIGVQQCTNYITPINNQNFTGIFCQCTQSTNLCNYFTPETNKWFNCASAPTMRYRHSAAYVNGKIYVVGGRSIPDDAIIYSIDVFDPLQNSWTTLPPNCEWYGLTSDGASFAFGTKLFVLGGYKNISYESVSTLASFDTKTMVWDHSLPPMNFDRGDISVQKFDDDNFYVIGGWQSGDGFCGALSYVEKYSVTQNKWTVMPEMFFGRGKPALGVMGNSIFTIAGETKKKSDVTCSYNVPVPYVSRYNPTQNKWVIEANISSNLFRFVGVSYNVSLSPHSRAIYLFGGQGSYDAATMSFQIMNTTIKYIPASTVSSSPSPAEDPLTGGDIAGIVIGGLVFIGLVCMCAVGYIAYRRRGKYTKQEEQELAKEVAAVEDDIEEEQEVAVSIHDREETI